MFDPSKLDLDLEENQEKKKNQTPRSSESDKISAAKAPILKETKKITETDTDSDFLGDLLDNEAKESLIKSDVSQKTEDNTVIETTDTQAMAEILTDDDNNPEPLDDISISKTPANFISSPMESETNSETIESIEKTEELEENIEENQEY